MHPAFTVASSLELVFLSRCIYEPSWFDTMNDSGTLVVFTLAIFLLVVLTMRMNTETLALITGCIVFFLICRKKMRDHDGADKLINPDHDSFDATMEDVSTTRPVADNSPIFSGKAANVDAITLLDKNQRPPEPKYPAVNEADRERISKSNKIAIGELYGRKSAAGAMDNAIYKHTQRIGDRDRQAIINQIRSRRTNTYEPFYRQELSEASQVRWWENNESVLVTKMDKHQQDTIDMGRFSNEDSDLDGIYGRW